MQKYWKSQALKNVEQVFLKFFFPNEIKGQEIVLCIFGYNIVQCAFQLSNMSEIREEKNNAKISRPLTSWSGSQSIKGQSPK